MLFYYIISYYTISYHVISYYIILYYVIFIFYIIRLFHIIFNLYHIILYYIHVVFVPIPSQQSPSTATPLRCKSCCSSDAEDRKDTEAQVLSLAAEVCHRYRLIADAGAMPGRFFKGDLWEM